MPNAGGPELLTIVLTVAIPCAFGYWCLTVLRKNGRSPAAGFALGFFLTWIGVIIAYAIGRPKQAPTPTPASYPTPPAPPGTTAD
jgi:hypothetical protein